MVDSSEPKRRSPAIAINYDNAPPRNPPLLEIGVLAWVRKNLFGSPLDALLTIVGVVLVAAVVVGTIEWTIERADWYSIILNVDRFMTGRLPGAVVWRVSIVVIFIMVTAGVLTAAYVRRLSPVIPLLLLLIALTVVIVPALVRALLPVPPAYLAAGAAPIISGTAEETPLPAVAFLARQNETLVIDFPAFAADDAGLAAMHGIVDRATNTLRNAAANRLSDMARYVEVVTLLARDEARLTATGGEYGDLTENGRATLQRELERLAAVVPPDSADAVAALRARLAAPALTPSEIDSLRAELAALVVPPTVVDTYRLNGQPVTLRLLDGNGTPAADEQVLVPGTTEPVRFLIPADGWYILEKTLPAGAEGAAILMARGIAPVFERSAGYLRLSDMFQFPGAAPVRDDDSLRPLVLNENRYRGDRSLEAYLYLYVTNFLVEIQIAVVAAIAAAAAGYAMAQQADRLFSPRDVPRRASQRLALWLLIATPVVVFVFINGFDLLAYSAALAWVVAIYAAYQAGLLLYQRGASTLVRLLAGVLLLAGAGLVFSLLPALIYDLPPTPPAFAGLLALPVAVAGLAGAWIGTGAGAAELTRRVTRAGGLAALLLIAPIIAGRVLPGSTRDSIAAILPYIDPDTWGGLLLALFITIYGTLLAFPLGILLALGRRSSLPAIKYPCILVIEMVRGTPFIVVLFAGQLLIPLVNENFAAIPNAYRALGATVIFVAAYLAENIRGGLQSIPGGQQEAGKALGLPEWQVTLYITLPQALRAVIPALVGQFISLFKDTSLLEIVGLTDLSRTVTNMVAQTEFNDARREGLVFITIIYFVLSYVIAYVSRRIEESGSGAARRI